MTVNAAIAVGPAALVGAGTSMATYTAFNPNDNWTWEGMLNAGLAGAIGGATGAAVGKAATFASKALGGPQVSGLRGVFGTAVGSGVSNMGISLARGADFKESLGFGLSGFATGAVGGSGAFGLAKKGMLGRLGYQAITSTVHSVGDNLAAGKERPFDNFTFGLGPVNFRIGTGEKLINYKDNAYTIWSNAIGFASVVSPIGKDNNISWDWRSLSPNYYGGGVIHSFYSWTKNIGATGLFSIYDIEQYENDAYLSDSRFKGSLFDHEGTHVWQSRAMGNLFYPTYIWNSYLGYDNNHFERQAFYDPF